MLLLGLDFETTGLDTNTDRIIEVGACLWSTDENAPWLTYGSFMADASYPPVPKVITDLTGITQDHLATLAKPPRVVFDELCALVAQADLIVAHNGTNFDRHLYNVERKRQERPMCAKPWLDTSVDVPYPDKIQTRKLVHLAAEHGFVNPFAHRALFDVMTTLHVLAKYDIDAVIRISLEPSYELVAKVQAPWQDEGASTNLAKARGYRWDGARKTWAKVVKKTFLEKEQSHGEFPIVVTEKTA